MDSNRLFDEAQRAAEVHFLRDELPTRGTFVQIRSKRQNPEWQPRRASVATCQRQQQQQHLIAQHYVHKTAYQFNLTGANIKELIAHKRVQQYNQEHKERNDLFVDRKWLHDCELAKNLEDLEIKRSEKHRESIRRGTATTQGAKERKGTPTIAMAKRSSCHEIVNDSVSRMARRRSSMTSPASTNATSMSAVRDQADVPSEFKLSSGVGKFESYHEMEVRPQDLEKTERLDQAVSDWKKEPSVDQKANGEQASDADTTCCFILGAETVTAGTVECSRNCAFRHNLTTSENMDEKLQKQDMQRKHVILSMALKQIMTEHSDTDRGKDKPVQIDEDSCQCCCRSRSCSLSSARNLLQASASTAFSIQADSRSAQTASVDSKTTSTEAARSHYANENSDVKAPNSSKKEDSFAEIIPNQIKRRYSGAFEGSRIVEAQEEDRKISRHQGTTKQKQQQHRNSYNIGEDLVTKLHSMRQLVEGKTSLECDESAQHNAHQWRNHPFQSDQRECAPGDYEVEYRPNSTLDQWHRVARVRNEAARRSYSALGKSNTSRMQSPSYTANHHNGVNLEALIVESWLDDHPNFTRDYIMRKATRQVVDDWLVANAKVSNTNLSSQVDLRSSTISRPVSQISLGGYLREPSWTGSDFFESVTNLDHYEPQTGPPLESLRANRSNSQSASLTNRAHGFVTPVRKISATDFETRTGSGFLRPMLSKTPDGRLTFLPQPSSYIARDQDDFVHERGVSKKHDTHQSSDRSENATLSASPRVNSFENDARTSSSCNTAINSSPHDANNPDATKHTKGANQVDDHDDDHDDGEVKLIFELVKNIYDDLDIRTLLHKILKNIAVLINADRSSLFLVCGGAGDPNRRLVSQLFNVDQDSIEVGEPDESITIPWGTGLVGFVAESGEAVNITDCYEDPRFTDAIDQRTGYLTKHMLCAPIFDKRNDIVGVAQVINKRDGNAFSKRDELKFMRYLQFCGIGLRNAQSYEHCQLENRRNQVLLDLARMVFEEQSTIEQVVYRIMLHTQSLLDCERCQVLLIDDGNDELEDLHRLSSYRDSAFQTNEASAIRRAEKCSQYRTLVMEPQMRSADDSGHLTGSTGSDQYQMAGTKLFSLVFDLECDGNDPVIHNSKEEDANSSKVGAPKTNRAFPVNIGITGYVAMTGETLNIVNAHEHDRFDVSVDDNSDFRHRSILCMPIRNGQRQIIGVIQLVNKKNGQPFNKNDEDLFEAFAIFCGLGIHNTLMYERVLKVMAKQRVTFEVLSYHATAPLEEAKKLSQEQVPSCYALNLASLKFNDFSLDEQYMLKSCLRFFFDLDLMRRFQIDQLVFCNWILSVQKNYRKVTYHPIVGGNGLKASPVRYHNWRHAFNVSQMMFAILMNTQICRALGELETLALLIACLCHDLDHRGTNNSFQIKSASPLAELYSTSTMEHHHFDQCVMILNSQGNQILSNLSPEEYSRVIMLLEEAILATDLANYFRNRDRFFQLINSNKLDWQNDAEHRSLLRCMLMTACDIAAITKPWPVQKVVADLVMSEFYQQGDIEKTELKIEPIDMMNRDKMSQLPSMQISFIDNICAPIYTAFAKLFPGELTTLLDGCLSNRNLWQKVSESRVHSETPLINFMGCNEEEPDDTHPSLPSSAASKSESNLLFCGSDATGSCGREPSETNEMEIPFNLREKESRTVRPESQLSQRGATKISHRKSI